VINQFMIGIVCQMYPEWNVVILWPT